MYGTNGNKHHKSASSIVPDAPFVVVPAGPDPSATEIFLRWDVTYDVPLMGIEKTNEKTKEKKLENATEKITTKTVLNNVSGYANPGQVMALMGPSGSGKTSLLNIISNRQKHGVSGKVLVNGAPHAPSFRKISGYVQQADNFLEVLTVRETLKFAARLRMPKSKAHSLDDRVSELLREINLGSVADSRIGTSGNGISGGERKRLSIACELICDPRVLFLDEPTSGLDAASALRLVTLLRRLADQFKTTIICSVHQPRAALLEMFDSVMLLAKGRVVYFGMPMPDMLDFFTNNGFPCPKYENPADFVLDLINIQEGNDQAELDKRIKLLCSAYESSDLKISSKQQRDGSEIVALSDTKYVTPFCNQFWVILQRSVLHKLREPFAVMTQAVSGTFMPLLLGSIFLQLGRSQSNINDIVRVISMVVMFQAFMPFDILLLFPIERNLYVREHDSGLYSTMAFYLGRSLAEMPSHILFSITTALITYFMIGFPIELYRITMWTLCLIGCTLCGASAFLMFGSLCETAEGSNSVATLFLLALILFDGTWISSENIPVYYRWMAALSYPKYTVEIALTAILKGMKFEVPDENLPHFSTGDEVLHLMGADDVDIVANFIYMVIFCVVCRFIAYFGFRLLFTGKTAKERLQE